MPVSLMSRLPIAGEGESAGDGGDPGGAAAGVGGAAAAAAAGPVRRGRGLLRCRLSYAAICMASQQQRQHSFSPAA